MVSDRQTELRLSRLENDTSSLYDLVDEVRSTLQEHTRRFDAVDGRFDAVDGRFDGIEATLVEVVRRLPAPS